MSPISNHFGRHFEQSKEIFELEDLMPGDHVVGESFLGLGFRFWHHMIVESTDLDQNMFNVIHYFHDLDPVWKLPSVCRDSINFTPNSFYRVVYKEKDCFPRDEVLQRAKERLGEKRYWPFTNNCEHFASECKTGKKKCQQIWSSVEALAKRAILSLGSFLGRAKKWFQMVCRSENGWLRQTGVTEVAEYGARFSTGFAIFVAFIIEIVLLGNDCRLAKTQYEEGKLSQKEYCEVIVKRVSAAVCSIPGFAIGFVLGGMVLPILGAFLGGAMGTYVGNKAGGYLGNVLTPLFIEHLLKCEETIVKKSEKCDGLQDCREIMKK